MKNLILRNTPEIANRFALEIMEAIEEKNCYEVEAVGEKIVLRGDCALSQAMAYYRYLKDCCGVNLSHCGNERIQVTQAPPPACKIEHVVGQEKRAYLNYCTFGYSMAWWDWERWERELDFMAMNGINLPLSAVGGEAVWYYTLRELGYSETGALSYLSGPAFWPWQLLTNIDNYFSLTDVAYIGARVELGKKIMDRQLALGMSPIQQGYSGQVPKNLIRLFPKARIRHVPSWNNFPIAYQLDPTDPLFQKIGGIFLEKQRQLFGAHHYYACDPFHENEPSVQGKAQPAYLHQLGRAVSKLHEKFDSQATWVMQSRSLREEIVKAVPKEKLLILDIDGSRYQKTEGFWGYPFVLGTLHNFGDRNSLHGSIAALAENPYAKVRAQYENAVGSGLFPEGIFQNPLYYDLAFEMLTQPAAIDLDTWLDSYARRRYGSDETCLKKAIQALRDSCYSEACTGRETGSILCTRPSTHWRHSAPNDVPELRYDNQKLFEAAELLLQAKESATDGYRYDVCDLTRQVLSNHAHTHYQTAMSGYRARDVQQFERGSNAFLKLFGELDRLLETRPELSLGRQLAAAPALATCDKDKQNFEINLLSQLTVWGPIETSRLYDYAWKEWGGLMNTFYLIRWRALFEKLAMEFQKRKDFSTDTKKQENGRDEYQGGEFQKGLAKFEKNWLATYKPPEEPSAEDTLEVARTLLEKYRKEILSS